MRKLHRKDGVFTLFVLALLLGIMLAAAPAASATTTTVTTCQGTVVAVLD